MMSVLVWAVNIICFVSLVELARAEEYSQVLLATSIEPPKQPSRGFCTALAAEVCAWQNAAFVTHTLEQRVASIASDEDADAFAREWVSDSSQWNVEGGFGAVLCTSDGTRCSASASDGAVNVVKMLETMQAEAPLAETDLELLVQVQAGGDFTWQDHYDRLVSQDSSTTRNATDGADVPLSRWMARGLSLAADAARSSERGQGAWFVIPCVFESGFDGGAAARLRGCECNQRLRNARAGTSRATPWHSLALLRRRRERRSTSRLAWSKTSRMCCATSLSSPSAPRSTSGLWTSRQTCELASRQEQTVTLASWRRVE